MLDSIISAFNSAGDFVGFLKDWFEANLHLSRDAMHVHIGLLVFLALAALIRNPRRYWLALAGLFVVCLINEAFDLNSHHRSGHPLHVIGSVKDIVNTMGWPTVWVLFGRHIVRAIERRGPFSQPISVSAMWRGRREP